MKHLKNQRGIAGILEVAIVVLVLGALGFVGYRVYQARLHKVTELSTFAPNRLYENKEYGFKFSYPKDWGDPAFRDGVVVSPGQGSYKQLTFSKQAKVDINFVTGPFASPLDGCPGYLTVAKHDFAAQRANTIGWTDSALKLYYNEFTADYRAQVPTVYMQKFTEKYAGWQKIKADGNTLSYELKDKTPYEVTDDYCGDIRVAQAEVDEANSYYQYVHFALNFSNSKVKGVNAHIDERSGRQPELYTPLTKALNSMVGL